MITVRLFLRSCCSRHHAKDLEAVAECRKLEELGIIDRLRVYEDPMGPPPEGGHWLRFETISP